MTFTNPEKPQDATKTPRQVEQETREELDKAKADLLKNMSAPEMIKTFFTDYKKLTSTERWQYLSAIVVALLFKKKATEQQTEGAAGTEGVLAEEETPEPAPGKKEEGGSKEPEKKDGNDSNKPSSTPLPPIDVAKFRGGADIFKSFSEHFPGVEITSKLKPLEDITSVSKPNPGASEWPKKSTGNWDYMKAGNTEEDMEKGMYRIQAIDRGKLDKQGYTQTGINSIPPETSKKLTAIAMALLNDSRMPLFTGIDMTVDGVQVMMMKEIHMHPRGSASAFLCQPHTGVSYILKKT